MKSRQLPCADVARASRGGAVLGSIKDRYGARPQFTIHSSSPESRFDRADMPPARETADVAKGDILEFPVPSLKRLQLLFDLTAAEARLAQLIACGDSVEEVAQKLSIKMTTARTQLAAVFAKTETRRQAKLVAILSRIAHLEERAAVGAERVVVPDAAA